MADAEGAVASVVRGTSSAAPELLAITITSADPGDLTLNQLNALARCDALVVDGTVAPAIIDRARRDAMRLEAVPDPLLPGLTVVVRG
jgi:uroporphyrin-III C-methyltransferase/precorrin-2 dehydrogenase/sirohydrochlorin ferrochelatase